MSKPQQLSNRIHASQPGKSAKRFATCREEVKFIGEYLADGLSGASRQAFEKHLTACPDCASFLATYKKTIDITRSFLKLQHSTA